MCSCTRASTPESYHSAMVWRMYIFEGKKHTTPSGTCSASTLDSGSRPQQKLHGGIDSKRLSSYSNTHTL